MGWGSSPDGRLKASLAQYRPDPASGRTQPPGMPSYFLPSLDPDVAFQQPPQVAGSKQPPEVRAGSVCTGVGLTGCDRKTNRKPFRKEP